MSMEAEGVVTFDCADCDQTFATEQGMKMHWTRTHKVKASSVGANDAFERVGRATEALFPEGIPAARVIEIADLQKAMLKVVTRA